jgi:hypothetical protein
MKNGMLFLAMGLWVTIATGACAAPPSAGPEVKAVLGAEYTLGSERSAEQRHYEMETRLVTFAPNGEVTERVTYRLLLAATPPKAGESHDATYRCQSLTVTVDDGPERALPSLAGWSYPFTLYADDETRPPLGIPHEPFVNLTDNTGQPLDPSVRYLVYNNFIDFHGFCDLFVRPTTEGGGIQDLKRIGDQVVHAAAHSEPRIDLGEVIGEGSKFKNGEITLGFRGLTVVDDVPCALIAFDSGDASYHMLMTPAPNMEIEVVGRSHYQGELSLELDSGWVRKGYLTEMVVSEVTAGGQSLVTSTTERTLEIRLLTEEQFAGR